MANKKGTNTFPIDSRIDITYLDIVNSKILSKFKVVYKLQKVLKNYPQDTLFLGIGTYANVLLGFLKNKNCCAIGCEHNAFNSVSNIWKVLRILTYKKLDAGVVLTYSDLKNMKSITKKTCVIPNSVPIIDTSADLSSTKFIAVGRLSYQKAFDKLINIFHRFSLNYPDWKLEIYGEGEDKDKLKRLITELNLNDKVSLNNFTDNIFEVYSSASGLLLTSRYEGLPMVLLEAQSYGLPIISYDCDTGPRDVIINGRNGYLIKIDDEKAYINALSSIANNFSLRKTMGENAKKDSLRFSEEEIYKKWIELFNSL